MDKRNRPSGRQKNYGPGNGNVRKRGRGLIRSKSRVPNNGPEHKSSLNRGNSRPAGNAGGYSGRPLSPAGNRSSRGTGRTASSRKNSFLLNRRSLIKIGILPALIIVILLMFCLFGSNPGNINSGKTTVAAAAEYDKGAYPVADSVSLFAREKRTVLRGSGNDKVTVMVYLCGTDLESMSGMATSDLEEMMKAKISEKVNIIVETGGTSEWNNNVISNKTNQRYRVTADGLELLESNLGKKPMIKPDTLSDFIKYCSGNYPADRYMLVLWDHGGGSTGGFGYDQNFQNDSMTLDEISTALKNGGCAFDVIGFDACLMATLETAAALEPYADYMIASEEIEPGIGWYYTGWITALSKNTSIASTDLGKILIDDYVKEAQTQTPGSQATLSLLDLAELKGTVPKPFSAFAVSAGKLIDKGEYKKVSEARADAKEFAASSGLNQIDLVSFAENIGTSQAKNFAKVLRACVKYNRTSSNIYNANGISVYYPNSGFSKLNSMLRTYEKIGIDGSYSQCIKSFASVTAGGQAASSGSGNALQTLLGGPSGNDQADSVTETAGELIDSFISGNNYSRFTGLSGKAAGWLDINRIKDSVKYYEKKRFDASKLVITEKHGGKVLDLPDKQWSLVQNLERNVFLDDGKGFLNLGLDNTYSFNKSGDLILDFDGTWLALNGRIVSCYMISEDRNGDEYMIKKSVPAILNGQLVDIILVFDNDNPDGKVLGAQIVYNTETQSATIAKGLLDIAAGDTIDFLCDYYTYNGRHNDTYRLGEQYTATGSWKIQNIKLPNDNCRMTYRITDIYNNKYWTPVVTN